MGKGGKQHSLIIFVASDLEVEILKEGILGNHLILEIKLSS